MGWKDESEKWLQGNTGQKARYDDVKNWILSDPVWQKADDIDIATGKGSHHIKIKVNEISKVIGGLRSDVFSISDSGGQEVLKWQVELLVKIYEQLEELP